MPNVHPPKMNVLAFNIQLGHTDVELSVHFWRTDKCNALQGLPVELSPFDKALPPFCSAAVSVSPRLSSRLDD